MAAKVTADCEGIKMYATNVEKQKLKTESGRLIYNLIQALSKLKAGDDRSISDVFALHALLRDTTRAIEKLEVGDLFTDDLK